jgi:hypothetical protein
MSGEGGIKTPHSRPPWVTSEFLDQASKYFLGPLQDDAVRIDGISSGIVAMAEMFVKLGSLQTVREVENYIISVGRVRFRLPFMLISELKANFDALAVSSSFLRLIRNLGVENSHPMLVCFPENEMESPVSR